jgi:excisionase family DNA binding protein
MSSMQQDAVLTTGEAIGYLKISKPTFLKYIRSGRIKAIKAGKGWRILQSELDRFLRGETDVNSDHLNNAPRAFHVVGQPQRV